MEGDEEKVREEYRGRSEGGRLGVNGRKLGNVSLR